MLRSLAVRFATAPGRAARARARGIRPDVPIPFDMFDVERNADEARAATKLEGIYHKGQRRQWSGKEVLPELIAKYGAIDVPPEQAIALSHVFAVILWGELAAWKISAQLALRIEGLEAKMAATSQAHDEARHFYTMHDYLAALGHKPGQVGPATEQVLSGVLQADSLVKQLLGMQVMIEPMALTLFQLVRRTRVEPVLCDLLALYERDEARHVALGVLHLPKLIAGMTRVEAADTWAWTFRALWNEFGLLAELAPHLRVLGIDPREVARVGRDKQVLAYSMMLEELGSDLPIIDAFMRACDARIAWTFPGQPDARRRDRLAEVVAALIDGRRDVKEVLTTVAA